MEPRFFLVDNTEDGFSCEILPVLYYKDILCCRNPVTLIQSIVRPCNLDTSADISRCMESSDSFELYNIHGDELFGVEEEEDIPLILEASTTMNSSVTQCKCMLPTPSSSQDGITNEHDIDGNMYLSNSR